jgi:1-acyl-sn-glycerol-3-phosphate acyltransferase
MNKLSKLILKLFGWTTLTTVPEPPKSVICVAPHTSYWVYVVGKLYYWSEGRKSHFLIKSSFFFFPLGIIFRKLGGVPVDRKNPTNVVKQMTEEFNRREKFHVAITPEGTRKFTKKWKMGFYQIAINAHVPIQLAYFDYAKKEVGITEIIYPTGEQTADMVKIRAFFKDRHARYPENFYSGER